MLTVILHFCLFKSFKFWMLLSIKLVQGFKKTSCESLSEQKHGPSCAMRQAQVKKKFWSSDHKLSVDWDPEIVFIETRHQSADHLQIDECKFLGLRLTDELKRTESGSQSTKSFWSDDLSVMIKTCCLLLQTNIFL